MASCCICIVNMTKSNPPELIMRPYAGVCASFFDKATQEFIYEDEERKPSDD